MKTYKVKLLDSKETYFIKAKDELQAIDKLKGNVAVVKINDTNSDVTNLINLLNKAEEARKSAWKLDRELKPKIKEAFINASKNSRSAYMDPKLAEKIYKEYDLTSAISKMREYRTNTSEIDKLVKQELTEYAKVKELEQQFKSELNKFNNKYGTNINPGTIYSTSDTARVKKEIKAAVKDAKSRDAKIYSPRDIKVGTKIKTRKGIYTVIKIYGEYCTIQYEDGRKYKSSIIDIVDDLNYAGHVYQMIDSAIKDSKVVLERNKALDIFEDIEEDRHWYQSNYNLDFDLRDHYLTISGNRSDLERLARDYHLSDYNVVIKDSNTVEDDITSQQYFTDQIAKAENVGKFTLWKDEEGYYYLDTTISRSGKRLQRLNTKNINEARNIAKEMLEFIEDKSVFSEETMNSIQKGVEKDYKENNERLKRMRK